jgi:hypothetical protein
VVASAAVSPVAASCAGPTPGNAVVGAEVEPWLAISPLDPSRFVGLWQQDRFDNGGAKALVLALSADGGATWQRRAMPFSRCGGAAPGSAGDFERATDPWVDIGADGAVHAMALSFDGGAFVPGSRSAMLAARSTDGGASFGPVQVLQLDGDAVFNDKNSLTADPTDARFVYATWGRLEPDGRGPMRLSRSEDAGLTWLPSQVAYDPAAPPGGGVAQTIGARIVVLPAGAERGVLVAVFTQIDTPATRPRTSTVRAMRSADKGLTWQPPVVVGTLEAIGARDPVSGRVIRDGAVLTSVAAGPDGALWVVWQDARFDAGRRDAIVFSRSTDGGRTWSVPARISRDTGSAAFTPAVHVRADGTVGVMHFDLSPPRTDAATIPAALRLLTTRDGVTWRETVLVEAFDLAPAPDARGLFLGDYHGLASTGTAFVPFVALSSSAPGNRTDVWNLRAAAASALDAGARPAAERHVRPTQRTALAAPERAAFADRREAAIVRAMEQRVPGWDERTRRGAAGL